MKRFLLVIFLMGIVSLPAVAQTAASYIESGVKQYNAMRNFGDGLKPGKVTDADLDTLYAYKKRGEAFLEQARSSASSDQQNVIRYFDTFLDYEIGFVLGMMGRNQDAYNIMNPLKNDFEFFTPSSMFPMRYEFDGKNYSIAYDNFAPTLAEYYTGMAEICANLSKPDESLVWSRKTIAFSYTTDWFRYIALNKILETKKKQDVWDQEVLDVALQHIQTYARLDSSYRRTVRENNYPTTKTSAERIVRTIEKKPELAKGEYHRGTAAPILIQVGNTEKGFQFYEVVINAGFADNNRAYLFQAAYDAEKNNNKAIGVLAVDRLRDKQSNTFSCDDWREVQRLYQVFNESAKAQEAKTRAQACEKAKADELARQQRIQKRNNREFGMYIATYPLAMATRYGRYRDYGLLVGINTRKLMIEGSYKLINRNHVIYDDLTFKSIDSDGYETYWEGYRAHLALKFRSANNSEFFFGPLFEVVQRNFEPVYSRVNTSQNVILYGGGEAKFLPVERSYNLFLNYGQNTQAKHFFFEMFIGFGVAYSQFDGGGMEYNSENFVIEHPLLENRKPTRFGPAIRCGLTLGLTTRKH